MLEELYSRFVEILRTATLAPLLQRTAAAYGEAMGLPYRLAYHHATHLAMHCGQIHTIRNLYRRLRHSDEMKAVFAKRSDSRSWPLCRGLKRNRVNYSAP